jgi:hypothetical protein
MRSGAAEGPDRSGLEMGAAMAEPTFIYPTGILSYQIAEAVIEEKPRVSQFPTVKARENVTKQVRPVH